jgi:Domain of unknown function (DUF4402)
MRGITRRLILSFSRKRHEQSCAVYGNDMLRLSKRIPAYFLLLATCFLLSSAARASTPVATDTSMDTSVVKTTMSFAEWSAETNSRDCSLSLLNNLNFGGIICSYTSGTVTVSPGGSASYTAGVIGHPGVQNYTVAAAEVELNLTNAEHCSNPDNCQNDNLEYCRNESDDLRTNDTRTSFERHGCAVTISISSSSTMTRSGGDCTGNGPYNMNVDNYTFTRTQGYISIGATLHVNANECSGNYSGTFTVTTNCQ